MGTVTSCYLESSFKVLELAELVSILRRSTDRYHRTLGAIWGLSKPNVYATILDTANSVLGREGTSRVCSPDLAREVANYSMQLDPRQLQHVGG
jgi:hypothetical protein